MVCNRRCLCSGGLHARQPWHFDFVLRGSMPERVPKSGTGSAATQAKPKPKFKTKGQNRKSKDPPFAEPAKDGAPTSKAKATATATATRKDLQVVRQRSGYRTWRRVGLPV
jgi:hypothetical protein